MKALKLSASVHYVADGKVKLPTAVNFLIPPFCARRGVDFDPGYCYRNVESWARFVKHEATKRWDFKVNQDAFMNVANLVNLFEGLYEPMTEAYFQYTIDEINGYLTRDD
jgi:hypothetical protein